MITTWLIIDCRGLNEQVRRTLMDSAQQRHNPRFYESTPWLEYDTNADGAIPTIQIYCPSQSEAFRLRKKLRDAFTAYTTRIPHPRHAGKEFVSHPLDDRITIKYTDEDGDKLDQEQMPKRTVG